MKKILTAIATVFALGFVTEMSAQCDTTATLCNKHIKDGFISDGQQYRALLLDDEVAEFHATFYGESSYRISACSGLDDGNLIFRLYDQDRNEIFNSANHMNAPYWDFEVENTLDVIIEAKLDETVANSGCAVLLIGFKQ